MTTTPRRDPLVILGLAVVALSAVATSFSALTGLADDAGWSRHVAFTLPLIVDTLGTVGTKVWLAGPTAIRPLARRVAVLAIICSVSGNIAYHLVVAGLLHPSVWLVVIIGAVPPVGLGLVGHLAAALATAPAAGAAEPVSAPLAELAVTPAPADAVPVSEPGSEPLPAPGIAAPADMPEPPARPAPAAKPRKIPSAIAGGDSWDQLIDRAAQVNAVSLDATGRPAGIAKLTKELKIGQPKARALRDALAASPA